MRHMRRPKLVERHLEPLGDPADPRGFDATLAAYLSWLATHNYSAQTVATRQDRVRRFAEWCLERGIVRPAEVTLPILERYQRRLYHYRKKDGKPMSFRHQRDRLSIVKGYFSWLTKHRHLLSNPASELELPRAERRLPPVLNLEEVERVLALADVATPFGLRDRAMLETLFSTGIRRMELAHLKLYDIDVDAGTVLVRQGKGKADRLIPIGERALSWIDKYLVEARPLLVVEPDDGMLFLTQFGDGFRINFLSGHIGGYVRRAGLAKAGACHLFRHTLATMMLEGGADIRFIQQMLGHSLLNSTQIYTHVSIRKLQEIYAATFVGARLERTRHRRAPLERSADEDARAELLATLEEEAAEETGGAGDE